MKRLLGYLKPYFGRISLGFVIKVVGTLMDLVIPYILAYMIDVVVPGGGDFSRIYWLGFIMIICSVIAVGGNIIANRMASRVARNTTEKIRHDLFSKILYLSCRKTDEFTVPSLESRLTSDTYNIHQMVGMLQRLGVRAPILLIGGIAITFAMEPVLTLTLVCILPFIAIVVYRVSKKGIPLYVKVQKHLDKMVRTVRENITGIRVIKALSKTDYEKERFLNANTELADMERRAGLTMAVTNPMMNLFLNLGLTLVILVGAFRVNSGVTNPGTIIAFMSYYTIILNSMLMITRIFVMYSKGSASAARIDEIMSSCEEIKIEQLPENSGNEEIVFDNVSFSYQGGSLNIDNVSFSLEKGQTLGIIGATGSGKSTIIQLLMRFYDVSRGNIYIGGRNVKSIPPEELHTMFGSVLQSDVLFNDTIRENISFGRDIGDERIMAAAKTAQAEEFISNIPEGLDYMLTAKGTNLSGGQKQRVLLSRALAGDARILIFDDSSSALDYATDAKLRSGVAENFGDKTSIFVAQRISSVKNCDKILVISGGQIIGSGSHEELLVTCGEYRQISRTQMGV